MSCMHGIALKPANLSLFGIFSRGRKMTKARLFWTLPFGGAAFGEFRVGKPSSPRPSLPQAGGEGEECLAVDTQGDTRSTRLPWANVSLPLWGAGVQGFTGRKIGSNHLYVSILLIAVIGWLGGATSRASSLDVIGLTVLRATTTNLNRTGIPGLQVEAE